MGWFSGPECSICTAASEVPAKQLVGFEEHRRQGQFQKTSLVWPIVAMGKGQSAKPVFHTFRRYTCCFISSKK